MATQRALDVARRLAESQLKQMSAVIVALWDLGLDEMATDLMRAREEWARAACKHVFAEPAESEAAE